MSVSKLVTARARVATVMREAREAAGITQEVLAKAVGVPQSVVSKIEAGSRRLDVAEFLMLCRAMHADPNRLLRMVALENARKAT